MGYIAMIIFVFYSTLMTASSRLKIDKYIAIIFLACVCFVFPSSVTVDYQQHIIVTSLVIFNLYLLELSVNLGSKVNRNLFPTFFERLWPLILVCLLSYIFVEQHLKSSGFPNIFPFFFYRGAQGAFLLALLTIVLFEINQGGKSRALRFTFVLIILSIVILESRTTYIAAALLLLLFASVSVSRSMVVLAILILISGFLYIFPNYLERISRLSEVARLLTLDLDAAVVDGHSLYRIIYWTGSLEIISEYWMTGIGFGLADIQERFSSDLQTLKSSISRPHNTYLSIIMGFGIVGALVYFFLLFRPALALIFKFQFTKKSMTPGRNILFGYILGVCIMMMGIDLETNPQFTTIFGFTLGYIRSNRLYQNDTGIHQPK